MLQESHQAAYVAPAVRGATVVFHENLSEQEALATELSARFRCAALLVLGFAGRIVLYHLYVDGQSVDAYVSSPHDELDLDGPAPAGDAGALCRAFGVEHRIKSVERVLARPSTPGSDYEYAINRHGELARALNLPLFAAGAGFATIEIGELPDGPGFEVGKLVRTG